MLKSYGWSSRVCWCEQSGMLVAHVILVSAQVLLVLTLGLWTLDLGLTINYFLWTSNPVHDLSLEDKQDEVF